MTQKNGMISFQNESGPPSKRKRTVTSCSECRRKKVKCEKGRPQCKGCIDSGKPDMCEYQEPSWNETLHLTSDYTTAANVPMAHISFSANTEPVSALNKTTAISSFPANTLPTASSGTVMSEDYSSSAPPSRETNNTYSNNRGQYDHYHRPQFSQGIQQIPGQQPGTFAFSQQLPLPTAQFPHTSAFSRAHEFLPQKVAHVESNLRGPPAPFGSIPGTPSSVSTNQPSDTMTFYDYYEPVFVRAGRLVASGPLSLASIMRKDPYLRVGVLKIRKEKNLLLYPFKNRSVSSQELVQQIIIDKEKNTNSKVDEAFRTTLLENEALDDVKASTNRNDTQLFAHSRKNYEADVVLMIKEVLPNQKLLWTLYDRFMNSPLAAFLPFINEHFLTEKIQEVTGKRSMEPVKLESIRISRRFDFAYISILLIILRLTFLTVSKTSNNTEEERYILKNPIGVNVINAAQMCINQFRLLRRGAIPLLQCSLFMRYYHKLAPEDGDGSDGGDSEVFLGMLLQMANSIGLNRDLSTVHVLGQNSRLANVWRFVWHEIVSLDLYQSMTKGTPILVDESSYDTHLPKWNEDALCWANPALHKAAIKNYEFNDEVNKRVRIIMKDILNIARPVHIPTLLQKVERLEIYIDANMHSLAWILNMPNETVSESVDKIHKLKNYIDLRTALYCIYHHIYIHNPIGNFGILYKAAYIAMELQPLAYFLSTINNGKTSYFDAVFGTGSQLILIPAILTSLHKVAQLLIAVAARALDVRYNYPDFAHVDKVNKIFTGFSESFGTVRTSFQSLSSVYYQAWRAYKGFNYVDKLLMDEKNNLWDKTSAMNKDCAAGDVDPDVNHLKAMPKDNDFTHMTAHQLDDLVALAHTKSFEEPVLKRLNSRSKKSCKPAASPIIDETKNKLNPELPATYVSSTQSDVSSGSTPALANGFHMTENILSNNELDNLWFKFMTDNTLNNVHEGENGNVQPLDGSLNGDTNDMSNISGVMNALDQDYTGVYGGPLDQLEKLIGDEMFDIDIPFNQKDKQ